MFFWEGLTEHCVYRHAISVCIWGQTNQKASGELCVEPAYVLLGGTHLNTVYRHAISCVWGIVISKSLRGAVCCI